MVFDKMLRELNLTLPIIGISRFSDDFIYDCEMDTEINLSLIFETFKTSKYQEFPHVLFRDVVINEERIIKALTK